MDEYKKTNTFAITIFVIISFLLLSIPIVNVLLKLNVDKENLKYYNDNNYYYCEVDVLSGKDTKILCGAISKEDYENIEKGNYGMVKIFLLVNDRYYYINSINITNIKIYNKNDWLPIKFY